MCLLMFLLMKPRVSHDTLLEVKTRSNFTLRNARGNAGVSFCSGAEGCIYFFREGEGTIKLLVRSW